MYTYMGVWGCMCQLSVHVCVGECVCVCVCVGCVCVYIRICTFWEDVHPCSYRSNFDKMKSILDPLVHIMHTVPSYTHQSHRWCRKHIDSLEAASLARKFWVLEWCEAKQVCLFAQSLFECDIYMESSASLIASTKSHRQLSVWPNTTHQVQQVIGEPNTNQYNYIYYGDIICCGLHSPLFIMASHSYA